VLSNFFSYNGHGFAHLIEKFLPILRTMGIGEGQIHTMTVENPARALALETMVAYLLHREGMALV
jgi:predicted metal-dependent phosphotriesterase family hydrolase